MLLAGLRHPVSLTPGQQRRVQPWTRWGPCVDCGLTPTANTRALLWCREGCGRQCYRREACSGLRRGSSVKGSGCAATGMLICNDSQWALNALKESGHSAHSILSPLRAYLRDLGNHVCLQWVPAHCSLLGNERVDEEARKAANFGPADGAQRGRISFEVVKHLICS
jgi:hypothetical protein